MSLKRHRLFLACVLVSFNWSPLSAITICGSDWPVWQLGQAMDKLGKFKDIKVKFDTYEGCINGFASGAYESAFLALYDFIGMQRGHQDSVIIGPTDYSSGGDVVVVRKEIEKASDLKGKTIALQSDSLSLFVFHLYLQANNMKLGDVKIKHVRGEQVSKEFNTDKSIAGIVGWNPNLDDALKSGGKKVATSADFKESVFDVVVVKKDSLNKNRQVYKDFMKTWYEQVMNKDVHKKAAEIVGVKEDEFAGMLQDAFIYKDAKAASSANRRMRSLVDEIHTFFKVKPSSIGGNQADLFGDKALSPGELFDL